MFHTEVRALVELFLRRNQKQAFWEYMETHPEDTDEESKDLLAALVNNKKHEEVYSGNQTKESGKSSIKRGRKKKYVQSI